MASEPYTAAAAPRTISMRSTCARLIDSHGAPPVDCVSTRTPSMYTAVKRVSAPRMYRLVVVPGPPLRDISMPAWRCSKSDTLTAPLRSTCSRSISVTSANTSVSGCATRVAVTTVSGRVGALACATSTASEGAPAVWANTGSAQDKASGKAASRKQGKR